ncbi:MULTISPECIES: hypothetical protein [unclassified Streptomyces]|uniref:hypothetical protein n=1 Tax=unclassified Streptomyces TaxID=2593676 RepID=UPI00081F3891|nr:MULTISPECIES: hypothetical protein [unclassified Streptomyces]MYZ37778.1 hypothetical protein [Streptomyces sp. SID4917]SCF94050.1 hypothetical protein GA0115259_105241 [Streptomyces sp. MnatMP-M17]
MEMEPTTDRALWGAVSIAVSMVVLAVGVLYAWMSPSDEPEGLVTVADANAEEGHSYTYTCHCHRDPVRVTIRAWEIPRGHR